MTDQLDLGLHNLVDDSTTENAVNTPLSRLILIFSIRSTAYQIATEIVLTRLSVPRSKPNPLFKLWKGRESNPRSLG